MVSQRGVKANPEKIKAILEMTPPKNQWEVQILYRRVTALGQFISSSAKRCLPFYKTLKTKTFKWGKECDQAFEDLKKFLLKPPLLSRPKDTEILYLYTSVCRDATTAVLSDLERCGAKISKNLKDGASLDTNGKEVEIILQSSPDSCVNRSTDEEGALEAGALREIIQMVNTTRGARHLIRTQTGNESPSDFVAELTGCSTPDLEVKQQWELYVGREKNEKGAGAGVILKGPHKVQIKYGVHLRSAKTNNMTEYEVLIAGLALAVEKLLREIEKRGGQWQRRKIGREENVEANIIAKAASEKSDKFQRMKLKEEISSPTINAPKNYHTQEIDKRMELIWRYLEEGKTSNDRGEEEKIRRAASQLIRGQPPWQEMHLCKDIIGRPWRQTQRSWSRNAINAKKHGDRSHSLAQETKPSCNPWPFAKWGMDILGPFPTAKNQKKMHLYGDRPFHLMG
ncbi:uncharacterized protein LOC126669749 [Mercurialis annua]|uniref:uncharacterized protein LOC126669749 n=1 Tax=Mercurialis annua TaxID=3986 RepID=UPI00215E0226|nr:uncharacterized protein LOC126669749 [Mercurialis annua]